jgi:hypothetical protein
MLWAKLGEPLQQVAAHQQHDHAPYGLKSTQAPHLYHKKAGQTFKHGCQLSFGYGIWYVLSYTFKACGTRPLGM